jgi:hypothetical protein
MKDYPNAFWAGMFILFAVFLSIIALKIPTQANATMAVIAIASNIVSGSFGFISGQLASRNAVQVPINDSTQPPTTTTVSVTPNPTPAAPKEG